MADPGITNKWVWHLRSREGPRNPPDEFEYLRDIQAYLLAIEMKGIYAGLVEVETKCTEIDQGNSSNTESNPDLSAEQWEDLGTLQRTLLDKHNDFYFASSPLRPQLHQFKKLAYDHSFHSRPLRRFSDRLLPLLRREQDLETSRRWLDVMKLTSSLIQILSDEYYYYEEVAFLDAFEQIEAILERLMLWFRNKYDSLNYNKDETEEQDLCEPTFEFPNNIRYICTTMPWTIRPALLVLWGVCWMFIIGSGGTEQEKLTAVDPITSPLPNTYNLQGDLPSIIGGEFLVNSVRVYLMGNSWTSNLGCQ
jgi:predicted membrane protein